MNIRNATIVACLVTAGCSLGTPSPDGDDLESTSAMHDDDHGEEGDDSAWGTPSDDPNAGGDLGGDEHAGFAGAAAPKGNNCVPGGYYCGGDKVSGDPKTLYRCQGPGTPAVAQRCTAGCKVNSGVDDSCAVDPSARAESPVPGKVVTYAFGVKNPRYAAGYHTGQDYATPIGSNAVAVRSGVVRWSNDAGGAYGRWIGVDADNGRTYVYCHLSSRLVAAGTRVSAGQVIAKTGATGNVTGPHLHFEDHPKGNFVYAQVRKPSW
jgi:Peptidase family M23